MRLLARTNDWTTMIGLGALLAACVDTPDPDCAGGALCHVGTPDAGTQLDPGTTEADAGGSPDPEPMPADEADAASPDTTQPTQPVAMDAGVSPSPEPQPQSVRKIDLLFMVDNSISMGDKQAILSRAAADFVGQLVNPPCVDAMGNRSPAPGGDVACAPGTTREFLPVADINIGVISSSLGDLGANVACAGGERDDRAHLIGSLPRGQGHGTNAAGVLELRPGGDAAALATNLRGLLDDVGQSGCGWEMSLEAWYRFAVDPLPYERLERVSCNGDPSAAANCVRPAIDENGAILPDTALLEQRAAFMRPDSLLAVVMLSDENDCSLQLSPQTWVVTAIDDARPMFRGSSACDANPNDPCCYSCPLGAPLGCESDPICEGDAEAGTLPNRLPAAADGLNLRCFDQKRRFGVDFLYPTQRYVNALRGRELCPTALDLDPEDCAGATIENPLYASGRDPSTVFLSSIVGVPWQAIAADASAAGTPLAESELRFKSPAELDADAWSALVGASTESPPVPPGNPFMVESSVSRANVASPNVINGREYATESSAQGAPDDLEYACIFPLPAPRDCNAVDRAAGEICDCFEGENDRPLCEQSPGQSEPGTTQFFSQAYPGLRQLEVLRGYGDNAALGSICARNVTDATRSDFGYRPALASLLERMQPELEQP